MRPWYIQTGPCGDRSYKPGELQVLYGVSSSHRVHMFWSTTGTGNNSVVKVRHRIGPSNLGFPEIIYTSNPLGARDARFCLSTMIRTAVAARRISGNALQARSFSITSLRRNKLPTTNSPIVNRLEFINSVTGSSKQIPTYRVLDGVGKPIEGAELPEVCFQTLWVFRQLFDQKIRLTKLMRIVFTSTCNFSRLWTPYCTTFNDRERSRST